MTQNKAPHILVAGGGIGGLTLALALLQRGIDVDVYEQAPELKPLGAGIQIGPNGSRILIGLGLEKALRPLVSEATGKEIRLWDSGRTWKLFDLGQDCIDRFGTPYWMIHRADLHEVLLDAIEQLKPGCIHLDAQTTGFRQTAEGVEVDFRNGQTARGDALIGADGVHSATRSAMGITDKPHFTGLMAWRGIAEMKALPEEMRRNVGTNWVGPGRHFITYPLRDGELMNFVGIVEGRDWSVESWTEAGTIEECLADFAGWHPHVQELIKAIDTPYKWAFLVREPMKIWADGRVCLIGDACHSTLPFLAQGANMAIEDGVILARAIEATPDRLPEVFKAFEDMRFERTAGVVNGSRRAADLFHNPILADRAKAEAYIDAEWAPDKVRTRYDWLFEYDALTAELPALAPLT